MLRKLFLFLLLPLLLLIILAYAAIPIWVSLLAPNFVSSDLLKYWQVDRIKVGYPSFNSWHINTLRASHTLEQNNQAVLNDITLTYQLQDLFQGRSPDIAITKANINLVNDSQAESLALQVLHPAPWLGQLPTLSITRFEAVIEKLTPTMDSIALSGKLNVDTQKANIVTRLTTDINDSIGTDKNNTFYIESNFNYDNHIDIAVFSEAQSTAIAKMTSQSKNTGVNILWQGKLALDMGFLPALVTSQFPKAINFSNANGKLTNNWRLSIPLQNIDSFTNILDAISGEHEIQIHTQTKQPWANTLSINANLTHTVVANNPDTWQINGGSQLFTNLNWQYLGIAPTTVANMGLETMELRISAPSAVLLDNTQPEHMGFTGLINATLGSDMVGYQLYSQLKNLRYGHTGTWHGDAHISGSYAFPIDSPLLQQLPIDIQKVQALAEVEFDLFADRWKLALAKNSNLSANQVFSQSKQGKWQLFVNDRLNLSLNEPLALIYHTAKDQWQWSNLKLSLQPETSTGNESANSKELGLRLTLPAGVSKLSQRVNQGSFELVAKDTQLVGWPSFNVAGTGIFILSDNSLEMAFSGDALPLSSEVEVGIDWQWQTQSNNRSSNIGTAEINAFNIPLVKLQGNDSNSWPFLLEQGKADYLGQWQWHTQGIDTQSQSDHKFTLQKATISHPHYHLTEANGQVLIKSEQQQLTTHYLIESPKLQLQPHLDNHPILDVSMALSGSSKGNKNLINILQNPDQWKLDKFAGKLMGGEILLDAPQDNLWQVNGINLSTLSKAIYPNIKAQGTLSGQLQLDKQWQLQGFQLSSDDKAQFNLMTPLTDDVPSASTLNQVLKAFTSDQLRLISSGNNATGDMPVTIQLQGTSPDFNNGETVDLNLQLDTNINQRLQKSAH